MYFKQDQLAKRPSELGGFGQIDIEVDPDLLQAQWRAVEPEITNWVRTVLEPSLSSGFTEGFRSLVPMLKKELTPQATLPYLVVVGAWAVGMLAGVWLISRNTGRK